MKKKYSLTFFALENLKPAFILLYADFLIFTAWKIGQNDF